MACSSGSNAKMSSPNVSTPAMAVTADAVDQKTSPVVFEIFGKIWNVQARLGQGVSASVYRVDSGRASSAVKEFQLDTQGGDYGYLKESSVLEKIQGHKNIGKPYKDQDELTNTELNQWFSTRESGTTLQTFLGAPISLKMM